MKHNLKILFISMIFAVVAKAALAEDSINFVVKEPLDTDSLIQGLDEDNENSVNDDAKNNKNPNNTGSGTNNSNINFAGFKDPFFRLNDDINSAFKSFWNDFDFEGAVDKSFDYVDKKMDTMKKAVKVYLSKEPVIEVNEENPDFVLVDIDLSNTGINKDSVEVTIKEGLISLKGEKKKRIEEKDSQGVTQVRHSYSMFRKSISIPKDIIPEDSEIDYDTKDKIIIKIPRD